MSIVGCRTRPQGVSGQKIGDYSWQCDCHIATQWCHREFNLILHNVTEILLATLGHPPLPAWLKPPLFTRPDQDCIKPKLKPLLPLWISCGLMLFFSMFCESCRQLVLSCQRDIISLLTMIFIICFLDPDPDHITLDHDFHDLLPWSWSSSHSHQIDCIVGN